MPNKINRYPNLLFLILLPTAVIFVYGRSLSVGYLADDYDLLAAAVSPDYGLPDVFPAGRGTFFRPLVMATLRLVHSLYPAAWLHHLLNVALHGANGLLLYWAGRLLTRKRLLPFAAALIFLLHPANVTAVYWISGRTDSLAALFMLLSLGGFIKFILSGRLLWFSAVYVGLAGALLSKELGAVLPILLLILWLLFYHHPADPLPEGRLRTAAWALLPLFILWLFYLAYLYLRFYSPAGNGLALDLTGSLVGLLLTPVLIFLPNSEAVWRALYLRLPWLLPAAGALLVLVGGLLVWVWFRFRLRRLMRPLFLLSALAFVPLLFLLVFSNGLSSRLLYLPLAVLLLAVLYGVRLWPGWGRPLLLAFLILAPPAAYFNLVQGEYWQANRQTVQAHCDDFRRLMETAGNDPPLLFLSAPYRLRRVPLFSNDLNATLFHCRQEQFGYYSDGLVLGSVVSEWPAETPGRVQVERREAGEYLVVLEGEGHYFLFPPDAAAGQTYTAPGVAVTVAGLRWDGEVTAFQVRFLEEGGEGRVVLYSDGRHFYRE